MVSILLATALKVACIGDSITYGYGLADRENTCYPHQFQLLLDAQFPGKYEVHPRNKIPFVELAINALR